MLDHFLLGSYYRLARLQDLFLHRFPSLVAPPSLNVLALENTTECPRQCRYCPHHEFEIPALRMSWGVFHSIVGSLAAHGFRGRIFFGLYGEPLTDDRLEAFLRHARANLPRAELVLCTNGDLLTAPLFRSLKSAGLDRCLLGKHSPEFSPQVEEALRAIRRDFRRVDGVEVIDYHRLFYAQRNRLGVLNNRGGLVDVEREPLTLCRDIRCTAIDCLGNVLLCCNDCTASYVFGNVLERDLYGIWEAEAFRSLRLSILKGARPFEICRRCASPRGLCTQKPEGEALRLPPAFHDGPRMPRP